jgi:HEPN domain-containing protein
MSERRDATDPSRWMDFAGGDLAAADVILEAGHPRQAAYLAQQASEKALKGLLYACGLTPARTHDLFALRRAVPVDRRARLDGIALERLNEWGVAERYPTDSPEVTTGVARACVADARAVVDAVTTELEAS